jgi:hypothetical protein
MKDRWNSLAVGSCSVIGVALLALSVTAGGSAVRAGDAVVDSVALEPLMKLADIFAQRIAKIEASVAAVGDSLKTRRIAVQELCVADDSGAQTCITKEQLDALLKGAVQTAQTAPQPPAHQLTSPPQTTLAAQTVPAVPAPSSEARGQDSRSQEPHSLAACQEKCVAPEAAIAAAPLETAPGTEVPAVKETAAVKETPEAAATGAKEAAPAEGAAATTPPATADQPQAADAPAGAAVIAADAKPETKPETKPKTATPADAAVKPTEPALSAPVTTGAAVAAVAAEAVTETKETGHKK